jgi:hypothetical protein
MRRTAAIAPSGASSSVRIPERFTRPSTGNPTWSGS